MQENPGAQVLTAVLKDPGRPRITWYGPDDERVELSGAVLANWVAKTAHLLLDELDAGPGTQVRLDLPMHWRTVVWALAVWHIGAEVRLEVTGAGVVVTTRPGRTSDARPDQTTTVAVALPALARGFTGPLPTGVLDYAATVLGHPDSPPPPWHGSGHECVLTTPRSRTTAADLLADTADQGRHLLVGADLSARSLRHIRALLAGNGSAVLVAPGLIDDDRLARIVTTERVDVVEPPRPS